MVRTSHPTTNEKVCREKPRLYVSCIECTLSRSGRPKIRMPHHTDIDLEGATRSVTVALREFERELATFIQDLAHSDALVSLDARFTSSRPVEAVCSAFATIDYGIADDAHSTVTCVGVVCSNQSTVAQAVRLNEAKARLQMACAPLQMHRMRVRVHDAEGNESVRMTTLVRVILRNIGRSHLNLLAAYRRVPILGARPTRIAFTRTLTRRVRRVPREVLLKRLEFSDKPAAAEDRARLRAATDRQFALVDPHSPNIRANIWYHSRDAHNRDCVQISAELPILYREGRPRALPEIAYPDAADWARTADSPRRPRATKLEADPFLRTLPVFRYRTLPRRR
jgi:hypothetical protein